MSQIRYTTTEVTAPRVAILGDLGGFRKPVYGRFRELGIKTSTSHIPDDLVIVQIGDLIGRSAEASAEFIRVVDSLRQHNPGQWIQLMGNWEARYHPHGVHFARQNKSEAPLDSAAQQTLNRFWTEPYAGVAATIHTQAMPPALLTHAGATRELIAEVSGLTHNDARIVAQDINDASVQPNLRPYIFAPGDMYQGSGTNPAPGPLWASPRELWRSWNSHPLRFDQVVGHAAPYMFNKNAWYDANPIPETEWAALNPDRKTTYWRPPDSHYGIIHIDPSLWHGATAHDLPAHIFSDATITIPTATTDPTAVAEIGRPTNLLIGLDGQRLADTPQLIRELLRTRTLTPDELSQASGISPTDITDYANGRTHPPITTLARLAKAVGATLTITMRLPQ